MKVHPLEFEKPIVELEKQLEELKKHSKSHAVDIDREVQSMEQKIEQTKREIYNQLSAWQRVQIARHTARPFALDYLRTAFSDYLELHGDRL
ncbi:MAG TPA: acetyl-CoA carboxylase carboxyl transferase subunit alpha, partial [Chthoniobacterales bacterium]|nr:acetyl-CoA carboxylase carboxyl transferase subunit alpha [Chthoniobacterales bacterium]